MKQGYTYEELIRDRAKRADFFEGYDLIISDLKKHGFYEAAESQIDSRDEMKAHFAKFD